MWICKFFLNAWPWELTSCDYNHCVAFLPGVLSDSFIGKVTDSIGNVYFRVGLILGVTVAFMQRMEMDFVKDSWRVAFHVLCKWRDTSPNRKNVEAMVKELTTALRSVELNDVAEMVKDGKCVG